MPDLFDFMKFDFMKNALVAILLITPMFGLIGTMVVNNKLAFFSDAIGHCALTGVAIGVVLEIRPPIISTVLFSSVLALLILYVKTEKNSSTDSIISVFSSTGIALGIVLLSKGGQFQKYSSYLVGDILSVQKQELFYIFFLLVIVLIFWVVFFNKLLLVGINSSVAKSKGINSKVFEVMLTLLIALVVSVSINFVGILIVNALLILPAVSSRNISKNIRQYHFFSLLFSMLSGVMGLFIAYYIGTSAVSTIVLVLALIFFTTFIISKRVGN